MLPGSVQVKFYVRGNANNQRSTQIGSAIVPPLDSDDLGKVHLLRDCVQLLLVGWQGVRVAKGSFQVLSNISGGDWQSVWSRYLDACQSCTKLVPRFVIKSVNLVVDSVASRSLLEESDLQLWRDQAAAVKAAAEQAVREQSVRGARAKKRNASAGRQATSVGLQQRSDGSISPMTGRKRLSVEVVDNSHSGGARPRFADQIEDCPPPGGACETDACASDLEIDSFEVGMGGTFVAPSPFNVSVPAAAAMAVDGEVGAASEGMLSQSAGGSPTIRGSFNPGSDSAAVNLVHSRWAVCFMLCACCCYCYMVPGVPYLLVDVSTVNPINGCVVFACRMMMTIGCLFCTT